jgi:very-short-patch-repair endonuclease
MSSWEREGVRALSLRFYSLYALFSLYAFRRCFDNERPQPARCRRVKPFTTSQIPAPDSEEALERYLAAVTRHLVESHWPLDLRTHLRRNQTQGEAALWQLLRDRQLCNLKFRRQHAIGPYFADFYCHEAQLVVELDGPRHAGRAARDGIRDRFMRKQGLEIVRIPSGEFLAFPERALERIARMALPRLKENTGE